MDAKSIRLSNSTQRNYTELKILRGKSTLANLSWDVRLFPHCSKNVLEEKVCLN